MVVLALWATAYSLPGITADGTHISWDSGNPRIIAASNEDLDSGRIRYGQRVCIEFPQGDKITYTVRDRCPACDSGEVDILVQTRERAIQFGRTYLRVTDGACPK
jgi:3D (Asp-Asp-Asp) domain-containing protein